MSLPIPPGESLRRKDYNPPSNLMTRIAVGILVDQDSLPLLHKTVVSAQTFSEHIFVLSAGDDCNVSEPNVSVMRDGWANDESASKNMLIDAVENANVADWLVWLNPGEEFDDATLAEFLHFVEHDGHRDFIYMMIVRRYFREDRVRHDFDEETIEARLMPLRKGVRFQGQVRASLLARSASLMTQISAAPGRVLLPPKKNDPARTAKHAMQTLTSLEIIENSGEALQDDLLAARAEAQCILGNYVDSRKTSMQLIKESTRSDLRLYAFYSIWETFAVAPIPDADITKVLVEAIDNYPIDMQLLTFLGSHMQRIGKLDLAIRTFETAVKHGKVSLDVWHRLHIREIAVTSLALCYRLQNQNDEAIQVLKVNAELVDDKSEFNRHLLDLYIAEIMEEEASALAAEIWGDADLDWIRLAIQGACKAKSGRWDIALSPLEEAYSKGCRDVLCLRWYALTLLALQQFPRAIEILDKWIALQPENSEAKSYRIAAQQPEQFGETMKRIRDSNLRSLGMITDKIAPRKPNVRIEDAVREMIQSSGTCGKITGFKPKFKPLK